MAFHGIGVAGMTAYPPLFIPSSRGDSVLQLTLETFHFETILLVWYVMQLFHTHISYELHFCSGQP